MCSFKVYYWYLAILKVWTAIKGHTYISQHSTMIFYSEVASNLMFTILNYLS